MTPDQWYYVQNGASVGPVSYAQMEALVRGGTVRPDTLVWPGAGEWVAAGSSALAPLFQPGGTGGGWNWLTGARGRRDFLPKDPKVRIAILVVVAAVGIFATMDGCRDLTDGTGFGLASGRLSIP